MALVRPGREAPETSQASTLLQRQKSGALLPKHRACHKNRFFQGRHTACLLQYIVYIELLPLYIQYIYIYCLVSLLAWSFRCPAALFLCHWRTYGGNNQLEFAKRLWNAVCVCDFGISDAI